jgi:hypothetical protein
MHPTRKYLHHDALRNALGLPKKLPTVGMEPKLLNGVWYYLAPQMPQKPRDPSRVWQRANRRMDHRLFAICPSCHRHVAAGRLAQHEGTEQCYTTYDALSRSGVGREEDLERELYNAREFVVKKDWSGYWWSTTHQQWFAAGVIPNEE